MHEGHFTEKIVEVILSELKKYPGKKIRRVAVRVGDVYHLVLDSVLMHFEILVKGSDLEGVQLDLFEEEMKVECDDCHKIGGVEDHHLPLCSYCHSRRVKIIGGNSINIVAIEFET